MTPQERITRYFLSESRKARERMKFGDQLSEAINAAMEIAKVRRTVFLDEEMKKHITYWLN